MKNRMETILFLIIIGIVGFFLYLDRGILTPFIVAAMFAYLTNPLVQFFKHTLHLSRTKAVILLYVLFLSIVFLVGFTAIRQLFVESVELQRSVGRLLITTKQQLATAPVWVREGVNDTLESIQASEYLSPKIILILFPQALSRALSFIIFVVAGFFFLKDGKRMITAALRVFPEEYQDDASQLLGKVNSILNSYLRGQLLIIAWVSSVLFIALTIMGVRFALLIALFSGFAEIIPFVGPIVATFTAVIVVLVTGSVNFSLTIVQGAIIVAAIFIVVRQIQDYVINPYVMQRATNLHPLLIIFSVLSGEHLFGIIGLLLAVPVVATVKLVVEFIRVRLADNKNKKTPGKE